MVYPSFFDFNLIDVAENELLIRRCKGQNKKKTLLVYQTNEQEQAQELSSFLDKVLAAAQLEAARDVLTLHIKKDEHFSFVGLCRQFDLSTLLVFGISPKRLGIHFQVNPYEILKYEKRTYVFVDDLQSIYEERQSGGKRMSGELWKILQALFLK